jgi:catechol 2,3-dioxygenase-like lactoylglutathione lyase family enzyme
MLDHLGIGVSDYEKSKRFFVQALAPLGYQVVMEFGEAAGFGVGGRPDFWVAQVAGGASGHTHICFAAPTRTVVDAFHKAALAAGGKDNGAPGLRPQQRRSGVSRASMIGRATAGAARRRPARPVGRGRRPLSWRASARARAPPGRDGRAPSGT